MNHLRRIQDSLCRELRAPKHKAAFEAARARSPELARYPDIGAVLDALSSKENESYRVREPLLRALFIQHKANASTNTWASLLYVAFYPMLVHLRYLLTTESMCHDDLDQLVMTSFFESLADLPLELVEDRLAMRLRQRTRRKVFDTLKDEDAYQSRLQELGRLAELWVAFDPFTESETRESNLAEHRQPVAHRLASKKPIGSFAVTVELELDPIPGWEGLPSHKRQAMFRRLVRQMEQEERIARERADRRVMGKRRLAKVDPRSRPRTRKPRTRQPLCHASSFESANEYKKTWRAFLDRYYRSSGMYLTGYRDVEFPVGSFRPPLTRICV